MFRHPSCTTATRFSAFRYTRGPSYRAPHTLGNTASTTLAGYGAVSLAVLDAVNTCGATKLHPRVVVCACAVTADLVLPLAAATTAASAGCGWLRIVVTNPCGARKTNQDFKRA